MGDTALILRLREDNQGLLAIVEPGTDRPPLDAAVVREQLAAQFEAVAMTSPDKAAAIIHSGVERGRARILVGPDAYLFDTLARIAPTHYYAVISRLQASLRARQKGAV